MYTSPTFEEFLKKYNSGFSQVVATSLTADLETPVSAMMKLANDEPNSFLLESVEGGLHRGRYSIIGFRPDIIWQCNGNIAHIIYGYILGAYPIIAMSFFILGINLYGYINWSRNL